MSAASSEEGHRITSVTHRFPHRFSLLFLNTRLRLLHVRHLCPYFGKAQLFATRDDGIARAFEKDEEEAGTRRGRAGADASKDTGFLGAKIEWVVVSRGSSEAVGTGSSVGSRTDDVVEKDAPGIVPSSSKPWQASQVHAFEQHRWAALAGSDKRRQRKAVREEACDGGW